MKLYTWCIKLRAWYYTTECDPVRQKQRVNYVTPWWERAVFGDWSIKLHPPTV